MKSTTDFLRELSWLLRGQILCLSYLTVPQPKTFNGRTVPAIYNHGILAYVRGFLTQSFTSVKSRLKKIGRAQIGRLLHPINRKKSI